MAAPPCHRPRSPLAALTEELVEEILFRIPPDARRYRAFHQAPPLLGYLHNLYHNGEGPIPQFVLTTVPSPPLSLPALVPGYRWALDCRHGRMLIHTTGYLIVWDPITGENKQLKVPPYPHNHYAAAVLCAKDGCGHLDCHGGPFLVVFVGTYDSGQDLDTWASVYSSETGVWSEQVTIVGVLECVMAKPSLLIGDALYFTLECCRILKYDVSRHALTEIEPPGVGMSIAMEVEDGELGFVVQFDNCIYKCLWQPSANNGKGRWAQHMILELEKLLPIPDPQTTYYEVMSFLEGTHTILISGFAGVFTLDLKSRNVKKVGESAAYYVILPYRSFYTPGNINLDPFLNMFTLYVYMYAYFHITLCVNLIKHSRVSKTQLAA
jgi:hypothetical protein